MVGRASKVEVQSGGAGKKMLGHLKRGSQWVEKSHQGTLPPTIGGGGGSPRFRGGGALRHGKSGLRSGSDSLSCCCAMIALQPFVVGCVNISEFGGFCVSMNPKF